MPAPAGLKSLSEVGAQAVACDQDYNARCPLVRVCVCVNVCVWNMVGVRLSRADLIQGFVYVSPSSSGLPGDCLPKVVA